MAELDAREKALQKREHALTKGKGEMRRNAEEDGLDKILLSEGGLRRDLEADIDDFQPDEDSEERIDRHKFDEQLEERLLNLSVAERAQADEIEAFERGIVLDDKHWSLKGEASSSMRPTDSLLELNVELPTYAAPRAFDYEDHLADAANTDADDGEEEEDALEKIVNTIIRRRVLHNMFDDVEPKDIDDVMPKEDEDNKELLDFQKSKLGLAEIYGEEFKRKVLRLPTKTDTEEDQRKVEIADMLSELLTILDNLSNAHYSTRNQYTKKGFNISQTAAKALTLSSKTPEEVLAPEHEVNEKEDMSRDERKALRRAKKQRRKKLKVT
eukprot:GHVH01006238.1.p1 GENE.GHVH01006238.1~~GHVH01006238.1.p1  ORF type:complete len:381 (+),score=92.60 GHVH01006238.1:164-1144(+)